MAAMIERPEITDQLAFRQSCFTPDFLTLKLKSKIPVFVYDEVKCGGNAHDYVMKNETLGAAKTSTVGFDLVRVCGTRPVARRCGATDMRRLGKIRGEVFIVDALQMLELDFYYQNGYCCEREPVWVNLMDQKLPTKGSSLSPSLRCWMWLGKKDWTEQEAKVQYIRREDSGVNFYSYTLKADQEMNYSHEGFRRPGASSFNAYDDMGPLDVPVYMT